MTCQVFCNSTLTKSARFWIQFGSSIQVAASTTWCILRFGSIFTVFSSPRSILGLAAAKSWLNKSCAALQFEIHIFLNAIQTQVKLHNKKVTWVMFLCRKQWWISMNFDGTSSSEVWSPFLGRSSVTSMVTWDSFGFDEDFLGIFCNKLPGNLPACNKLLLHWPSSQLISLPLGCVRLVIFFRLKLPWCFTFHYVDMLHIKSNETYLEHGKLHFLSWQHPLSH